MKKNIKIINFQNTITKKEDLNFGIISEVKDGCAIVRGLKGAYIGEQLWLLGVTGMANVLSINKNNDIYVLLFTLNNDVKQNTLVFKTNNMSSINIDSKVLGKITRPI